MPNFGSVALYGQYWADDDGYVSDQSVVTRLSTWGFNVHWSRNNDVALMELGNEYFPDIVLHYGNLSTGNALLLPFYLVDGNYDHVFGLSPDGSRVALATDQFFSDDMEYSPEFWQKLIIWDAPRHDEACACTYDPVSHVIYSEKDNQGHNFAGVGFMDENTIFYIGNEGLFRHNLSTGESSLLDPAFNTYWINLAIFSPDNRHIAVTTSQGLYVLETGIGG